MKAFVLTGYGGPEATELREVPQPRPAQARKHGVSYRYLFMHPSGRELAELARLVEDRRLEPVIDRVFPFAGIGDAFAYLEAGHAKGKVVVRMSDG